MKPHVDIIIPNFNGLRFFAVCLQSINLQTYTPFIVWTVDNGSTDGSAEWIRKNYPDVRVVCLPENRGFSAAVNAGIAQSNAPYIFLLNNDTELPPYCLSSLVEAAENLKEYDFFAPKMMSFHNRDVLDGAGDGFLRGGAGYRLGTMEKDSACYNRPGPVFGACGGAVLYRRSLFDRVGLLDEDFFAYLEDVDLNLRINRAGFQGYYVPEAVVYHIGSATTGSRINEFTIRLSTRNSFLVLLKNYSFLIFFRFLPIIFIYQLTWVIFVLKKKHFIAYLQGIGQVFPLMTRMRRKHREIRKTDAMTAVQLSRCLKEAEKSVVTSIMRRRSAEGKGNMLLRVYDFLFL